jgi:glutathione synthase/RimK-type ligase-like ATP-grasp enzyme
LQARGVAIPPTEWRTGIAAAELDGMFERLATDEVVIKPVIGANADDTYRVTRAGARALGAELERVFAHRDCIVQPFLPAVVDEGEFSLIYFNGVHSHTILKTPKQHDFRVQEEHGGLIRPVTAEPELQQRADAAVRAAAPVPLYARADLVRSDRTFVLMELELIEPALYFRMDTGAPARFARAFEEWIARPPSAGQ